MDDLLPLRTCDERDESSLDCGWQCIRASAHKTQIETENKNINKNGSETKEERKEQDDDWSPLMFI